MQPLHRTLNAVLEHVDGSGDYTAELKSTTKIIANSIQQNLVTIYPTGLYGAETKVVKSSIVQTLKEIKSDFAEKPWLAALKSIGTGLKLAGIGKAIYKGEFGVGDIKDVTAMSGLNSVSNAMISTPPIDILGIANLFVEKAIELIENPKEVIAKLE